MPAPTYPALPPKTKRKGKSTGLKGQQTVSKVPAEDLLDPVHNVSKDNRRYYTYPYDCNEIKISIEAIRAQIQDVHGMSNALICQWCKAFSTKNHDSLVVHEKKCKGKYDMLYIKVCTCTINKT